MPLALLLPLTEPELCVVTDEPHARISGAKVKPKERRTMSTCSRLRPPAVQASGEEAGEGSAARVAEARHRHSHRVADRQQEIGVAPAAIVEQPPRREPSAAA